MAAGIPKEVAATTVNMVCGSGLRAIALGYQAIRSGDAKVVVAGGQESMSQVCVCSCLRACVVCACVCVCVNAYMCVCRI